MASLNSSLSIAVHSLEAATGVLQLTNNNIANANTPGYVRQVAVLQEAVSASGSGVSSDNGVVLEGYQSVRDELIQSQIQQETEAQGGASAQLSSLQQIQTSFTTSTSDIGTEMSALFSSISTLSTEPTSESAQSAVLSAGQNLATAFNTASNTLTTQQAGLNSQVTQDVTQINELSKQIAALNPQLAQLKATGQDGGTVQDQQDQLILKLAALTSVSITHGSEGETITTGNGAPLVMGSQSFTLKATTTSTTTPGVVQVLDQNGNNVTASLTGGDLGGTIQMRDAVIPSILTNLNTLANQFGNAMNAAQASGFDQNGNAGTNMFTVSATVAGSAATIKMALTDPALIASSSDGLAGSNGNLVNLSAVQTTALPSGQTPVDAYASLVYQVGSLTSNANAESTATTASLLQLNTQLSSVSGVSIDEESTNLITFQQAYEAAARVVSTIQALFQVTMSMGTAAAA